MADVDFRVKNGLITGANNTTLGTAVTVLIGGNVGVGDNNPSYKLAVSGTLNATGAITQAGNQVLHATNFNTYTPTLTGTGASGTWAINVTGTANSVIGNIRGTINGTIAWGSGQVITSSGTNYFQLNSGSQLGVYDSTRAGYVIRANHNDHIRLVEAGGNVYVYGSRLYNDSSQQFVYQNSGNWSINAFNISQYPLNQSVLTTAAPTFNGLTATGQVAITTSGTPLLAVNAPSASPWAISLVRTDLGTASKVYNDNGSRWNFEHRPIWAGFTPLDSNNYNSYAVARTSTNRNGVIKLFRNDSDSDYNVQTSYNSDRSGYWSLRGYNGDTYHAGCFVAYAGYADSAGSTPSATNSTTVGGYGVSISQAASTVVVRDGSGYAYFNYINSNTGNAENPAVSQVIVTNGTDGFYRKASISHFTAYVQSNASGSWGINITGNAATATSATTAASASSVAWTNVSGRPTALSSFSNDLGNYGGWITSSGSCAFATYSGYFAGSTFCYTTSGLSVGTSSNPYGAGHIVATQNITAYYSDRRLKKDIKPISDALNKINKISGITFRSNDIAASFGYDDTEEQVGVIAQEIQQVLPQAVKPAPFDIDKVDGKLISKSGENYMTVQYEKIVPLLIQAIKEQQEQIDELKKR